MTRSRRRPERWALIATLLTLVASSAMAQATRGVVRDSTANTPLSGAIVMAIDSSGLTTARAITDSAGRFSLSVAQARRLRFVRIGYVPREADVGERIDLAMIRIPPLLTAVRVAEREVCPTDDAARSAAAWRIWDQARAGLLGTVVAEMTNPVTATTLLYQRRVTTYDHLVRRQNVEERSGTVDRPFSSVEPSRLIARGYLDEDPTGRTFHGPDAVALLDESFTTTHCFGTQTADAEHRGQIGLTFTPIPSRDTVVDVAGVIWLDTSGTALRSLEFTYTALEPAALKVNVGGRIGFRAMSNGVVFVDRWSLRVPVMAAILSSALPAGNPTDGKSRRMANTRARVSEIEEVGGVVMNAAWQDSTTWRAALTGITGIVRELGADSPVPGAIVSLDGSNDVTLSNRDGEYMLAPVLPGRYMLSVLDTSLTRHASPRRMSRAVDVGVDELVRVSPRVESFVEVVADVCKGRREAHIITGRVTATTTLSSSARIRATWASPSGDSATSDTRLDDRGRFLICGPNAEAQVALRLQSGRAESDTTMDVGYTLNTYVEWNATLHETLTASETRVVRGVVTDSGFRPIARVSVSVAGSSAAFTDDTGAFHLRLPKREAATLELRRLGYAPARFGLGAGGDTSISATLLLSAQQLEAMAVRAAAPTSANLRGFEERLLRRARGITFGTFITAEEIERRNPGRISNMLDEVPWAAVRQYGLSSNAIYLRTPRGECAATVYIDGVRVMGELPPKNGEPLSGNPVAIDNLVSPQSVAGIEAYRTGFDAPPQFQSFAGTCAVIVIWTK